MKNIQRTVLIIEEDLSQYLLWSAAISTFSDDIIIEWVSNAGDAVRSIMQMQIEGRMHDLIISEIFLFGNGTGIDLWRIYHQETKHFILSSLLSVNKLHSILCDGTERPQYHPKPLAPEARFEILRKIFDVEVKLSA